VSVFGGGAGGGGCFFIFPVGGAGGGVCFLGVCVFFFWAGVVAFLHGVILDRHRVNFKMGESEPAAPL